MVNFPFCPINEQTNEFRFSPIKEETQGVENVHFFLAKEELRQARYCTGVLFLP